MLTTKNPPIQPKGIKGLTAWGSSGAVGFTSRLAAWGLLVGIASPLLSTFVGPSVALWFTAGAGLVMGGLGAAALSGMVLRRRDIRLTWRVGAALGVPFGLSAVVVGLWRFLGSPENAFNPPMVVAGAMFILMTVGLVLSVMLGVDVLRFVIGSVRREDDSEPRAT